MAEARSSSGTPPASATDEGELSFEAALERLGALVDRLEGGELELEAALAGFEEGVRLSRRCNEQLDAAQRRIDVLLKQGDEWLARPFDEEADGREQPEDDPEDDA